MMTCREASTLMSTGELDHAPLSARLALRLHLAVCRHCRTFKRQIEELAKAARSLSSSQAAEPPPDFEATVAESLTRKRSS